MAVRFARPTYPRAIGEGVAAGYRKMTRDAGGVVDYIGRSYIAHADKDRAAYVSYRGVKVVSRLLRAKQKSREIKWGPTAAGYTSQLRDQILKIYPIPPEEDEGDPEAA